jgi:hypothetical protein
MDENWIVHPVQVGRRRLSSVAQDMAAATLALGLAIGRFGVSHKAGGRNFKEPARASRRDRRCP